MRLTPLVPATLCLSTLALLLTAAAADPAAITGSGKPASAVRSVAAFRAIAVNGPVDLEFRVGPTQRVEITADDNLLPLITTTVRDNSLTIDVARRPISTRRPIRAIVVAPALDALAVRGSGDARLDGLRAGSFAVALEGSGDARLAGTAATLGASVKGSGNLEAEGLLVKTAAVDVKGSGDVAVHASETVAASIHGSGDIVIYGRPKSVARNVRGSGSIQVR